MFWEDYFQLRVVGETETFSGPCNPGDKSKCTYTKRVYSDGDWRCPSGWKDTNCSWGDAGNEELQCSKCGKKHTCNIGNPKKCRYAQPTYRRGKWRCPKKYKSTGCNWDDGENGERQCKKCSKKKNLASAKSATYDMMVPAVALQAKDQGGGASGKTNITFYGQSKADDNGEGFTGIDLFKHGKANIAFQGNRVYPCAVHQKHFGDYGYKVLHVQGSGIRPVYLHVVDCCDGGQSVCNRNVRQNGLDFLVDIHATAFDAVGKSDGVLTGTYSVVGQIRPRELPTSVWMPKVANGSDSMLCGCSGTCSDSSQKWTTLKQCA